MSRCFVLLGLASSNNLDLQDGTREFRNSLREVVVQACYVSRVLGARRLQPISRLGCDDKSLRVLTVCARRLVLEQ